MPELNNQPTIKGVIFDKTVRKVPDKKGKNNGEPYFFITLVLETDNPANKKKTFPQFDLGTKAGNGSDFNIGDEVAITYYLERDLQEWIDKTTGEKVRKYVAKNKGIYIRKLDTNVLVNVGSKTSDDFRIEERQKNISEKETLFTGEKPEDDDDLPF